VKVSRGSEDVGRVVKGDVKLERNILKRTWDGKRRVESRAGKK
jgi:hypothetical protein